jgi:hypothetical protein
MRHAWPPQPSWLLLLLLHGPPCLLALHMLDPTPAARSSSTTSRQHQAQKHKSGRQIYRRQAVLAAAVPMQAVVTNHVRMHGVQHNGVPCGSLYMQMQSATDSSNTQKSTASQQHADCVPQLLRNSIQDTASSAYLLRLFRILLRKGNSAYLAAGNTLNTQHQQCIRECAVFTPWSKQGCRI